MNDIKAVIKQQTNKKIAHFLNILGFECTNVLEFLKDHHIYYGSIDKFNLIIDISLRYVIAEHLPAIRNSHLQLNHVYNSIYNQFIKR